MISKNCDRECNQSNCPFRTDPFDRYREVCVKCGQDYSFRRNGFLPFLILWAIAGVLLLTNDPSPKNESQLEPESPSKDLQSKSLDQSYSVGGTLVNKDEH